MLRVFKSQSCSNSQSTKRDCDWIHHSSPHLSRVTGMRVSLRWRKKSLVVKKGVFSSLVACAAGDNIVRRPVSFKEIFAWHRLLECSETHNLQGSLSSVKRMQAKYRKSVLVACLAMDMPCWENGRPNSHLLPLLKIQVILLKHATLC